MENDNLKYKIIFEFCRELFYVLSVASAVFAILEIIWPGVVLAYININWVLIFWLVAGIVIILNNNINNND